MPQTVLPQDTPRTAVMPTTGTPDPIVATPQTPLSTAPDRNAAISAAELVRPVQTALLKLLRKEPALSFTLAYLFLAAVGITYDFWFFLFFGVNVLNYADFTDFLLAAVREPVVLTFTVLSAACILLLQEINYRARVRFPLYDRLCRNPWVSVRQAASPSFTIIATVAYFGGVFTPLYAQYRAEQIQAGHTRPAIVRLVSETPTAKPAPVRVTRIIGTTSRFIFLYDVATKKTRIVPFDNVAEISVARHRVRD